MKTSTQILPGIKFIGWVDSRNLPNRIDLAAICGMTVAVLTDIHEVPFFDNPQCDCVTKKDGAGYEDTASLKFQTGEALPISDFLAFVVTDVNDKSFIIGSKERPATAAPTQSTGTPSNGSAGFEYEITHVAIKSMAPCII